MTTRSTALLAGLLMLLARPGFAWPLGIREPDPIWEMKAAREARELSKQYESEEKWREALDALRAATLLDPDEERAAGRVRFLSDRLRARALRELESAAGSLENGDLGDVWKIVGDAQRIRSATAEATDPESLDSMRLGILLQEVQRDAVTVDLAQQRAPVREPQRCHTHLPPRTIYETDPSKLPGTPVLRQEWAPMIDRTGHWQEL